MLVILLYSWRLLSTLPAVNAENRLFLLEPRPLEKPLKVATRIVWLASRPALHAPFGRLSADEQLRIPKLFIHTAAYLYDLFCSNALSVPTVGTKRATEVTTWNGRWWNSLDRSRR